MSMTQTSIDQIQKILNQDNFWRFFVDGKKQHEGDEEAKLGYLDWALREPHSLNKLRQTAKLLFTETGLEVDLSLELIEKLHRGAFPYEDDLLTSWESCLPEFPRTFGQCDKKSKDYLEKRAKEILTPKRIVPIG